MSNTDLVGELLLATERLADVLERETECLRDGRLGELPALATEKAELTKAYEAFFSGFLAVGAASLDPLTREALVQAGQRLRHAASLNARAIEAARSVTSQLIGAVTKAAAAEESRTRGYGAALFPTAKPRSALSFTLDQRL